MSSDGATVETSEFEGRLGPFGLGTARLVRRGVRPEVDCSMGLINPDFESTCVDGEEHDAQLSMFASTGARDCDQVAKSQQQTWPSGSDHSKPGHVLRGQWFEVRREVLHGNFAGRWRSGSRPEPCSGLRRESWRFKLTGR